MKLTAAQIESFVRNVPKAVKAVLVYGPDSGLVDERAETISKQILGENPDPFCLTDLNSDKLKDDPATIIDEVNSISFFGGRKLIKIRHAPENAAKAIIKSIEFIPFGDNAPFLLVTAGELTPRSSLRAFFEKDKSCYAVPCYVDDLNSVAGIVRNRLRENGYQHENGVVELLANCLSGNRMLLTREMEKLFLFKGDDKKITVSDVNTILVEASESNLDELCLAIADRDIKKTFRHYEKSLLQGAEPVRIIRYISGYFSKINFVYGKVKERISEQEAINSVRPPIFFKNLPYFKRHVGFWAKSNTPENNKLDKAFSLLLKAEMDAKSNSDPDLTCSHYLLELCRIN